MQCTASSPDGSGVVSTDGKQVAIFEGKPVELKIAVKIGAERFTSGGFQVRCKRRQHVVFEQSCDEAEFQSAIPIQPDELPSTRSRLGFVGSARSI